MSFWTKIRRFNKEVVKVQKQIPKHYLKKGKDIYKKHKILDNLFIFSCADN